ncbi:hypothetical protein PoB_003837900 [Plakobranchus ocellatus]|uniref:Uncharacterized protein n=1 Tax=Plakobranchus ocellatus TaxID=259542 RepID=A0AAV4AZQ4_9GAST|nr:hypothetical protein PoB_003837900 [Plakobranchus ocellatus]
MCAGVEEKEPIAVADSDAGRLLPASGQNCRSDERARYLGPPGRSPIVEMTSKIKRATQVQSRVIPLGLAKHHSLTTHIQASR